MRIGCRAPRRREKPRATVWWLVMRALILSAMFVLAARAGSASGVPPEPHARIEGGAGGWQWPVPSPVIVSAYAAPPTRYAAGHRGIDIAVSRGQPVVAPADGLVRFAGTVVDRSVLTLDHGGGVLSSFEPVTSDLPVGAPVARGAVIATVAAGGHCGSECLHVGVRVDGEYVSPLLFLARVPPAVLLPLGPGP